MAATVPSAPDAPEGTLAVVLSVFGSTRTSDDFAQEGVHKLPNAEAMPPQGFSMPGTGSIFLFVFASTRSIESFAGK